jgi:hypothetical protein
MNQNSPVVSVCLPSLNTAKYISERIASIKRQNLEQYEVIVADSFSTDGTWEALCEWARMDSRVHLKQLPKGLYESWNDCIQRSRGKWIYIATSDDTMIPEALDILVRTGERSGCDIVTSQEWRIDANGDKILPSQSHLIDLFQFSRRTKSSNAINTEKEINYGLIVGSPTVSITQMLINRDVFTTIGLFSNAYGSYGDYHWQLKALCNCTWAKAEREIGAWRVHAKQATSSDSGKLAIARTNAIKALAAIEYCNWKASTRIAFGFAIGRFLPGSRLELKGSTYAVATATAYCPERFIRIWQWMIAVFTVLLNIKIFSTLNSLRKDQCAK